MTVWRPVTCDCVIEYDGAKRFLRALAKCPKHEKYMGNELLTNVVKDNRKITKDSKPKKHWWSFR